MKYTYYYNIQGIRKDAHYLVMQFDRQLSDRYFYRTYKRCHNPKIINLMDAIAHTPNVIRDDSFNGLSTSELILIEGASITARIVPLVNVPEIANQIAKKVQRRFAKGESRQRIKVAELDKYADKLKAKTYGA